MASFKAMPDNSIFFFSNSDQSYLLPKEFQTIWSNHKEILNNPICSPRNSDQSCLLPERILTNPHPLTKDLWMILPVHEGPLIHPACFFRNSRKSHLLMKECRTILSDHKGILTSLVCSPRNFNQSSPLPENIFKPTSNSE